MPIDIEALSAPVSDDQPAGPDLSYESERQQIEQVFERSVSDDSGGGEEPDWRSTINLIVGEAEKTRDLWLPAYLMRAAALSGNFELLSEGAELLARLLEDHWAQVHPQLDEYGFIGRKTPCESLTRIAEFLGPLSRLPLIEHQRLGRYTGADFERFRDQGSAAANYGMFRALLEATEPDKLQCVVDRLDNIGLSIRRADAVLTVNAEGDTATNFQPTYDALDKFRRAVASFLPAGAEPEFSEDDVSGSFGASASKPQQTTNGQAYNGSITSRDDVVRALDAISAYYARFEPASPVPLALSRAKEWISLDFLAVLEDIAPGGLAEASRILKSTRSGSVSGGNSFSEPLPDVSGEPGNEPFPSATTSDGW